MIFRNLRSYKIQIPSTWTAWNLSEKLSATSFQPCSASAMASRGWCPPRDGRLVHAVGTHWLLALAIEEKLLPASVVRHTASIRAAKIEADQGRRVGRKELRELRESVAQELMARALSTHRRTMAWVDPVGGWLHIDAATNAKADEVIEAFVKAVGDDLQIVLIRPKCSPHIAITEWLAEGEAPRPFSIDRDLKLRQAGEGQATITYAHHSIDGDEIKRHLADGKYAAYLAMTWNDRVSFVVTDKMEIKRLSFLDVVRQESGEAANADEAFDMDFALMTCELSRMLDDLVAAFGGEVD